MKNNKEAKYIAGCDPYKESNESLKIVIWDTAKGTFEEVNLEEKSFKITLPKNFDTQDDKTLKQLLEEQEFYRQKASEIVGIPASLFKDKKL